MGSSRTTVKFELVEVEIDEEKKVARCMLNNNGHMSDPKIAQIYRWAINELAAEGYTVIFSGGN